MSTDVFTPDQRSAVMRRVKGRDTTPELKLRKLLTRMGLRYRLHRKDLPGSPDVAFMGRRVAIFMHGCFWHGHDCRRGARRPKANADYWLAKIGRNRARDAASLAALDAMGWRARCDLGVRPEGRGGGGSPPPRPFSVAPRALGWPTTLNRS